LLIIGLFIVGYCSLIFETYLGILILYNEKIRGKFLWNFANLLAANGKYRSLFLSFLNFNRFYDLFEEMDLSN